MAERPNPDDAASAFLRTLDKEALVRIALDDAKNWLAHDGLWFQAVESVRGMDEAIAADRAAWERFTVVEAKRIMERLGMKPGGGIPALLECLNHRLYARLNTQEATEVTAERAVFVMRDCRVQSARKRKGLPDFPCKSVGRGRVRRVREDHRPADPDALHRVPARRARGRRVVRVGVHDRGGRVTRPRHPEPELVSNPRRPPPRLRYALAATLLVLAAACSDRRPAAEPAPAPRDRPLAQDGTAARALTSTPDRARVQLDLAAVRAGLQAYRRERNAWPRSRSWSCPERSATRPT